MVVVFLPSDKIFAPRKTLLLSGGGLKKDKYNHFPPEKERNDRRRSVLPRNIPDLFCCSLFKKKKLTDTMPETKRKIKKQW